VLETAAKLLQNAELNATPDLRAERFDAERLTLEPLRVEHADELAPLLDDTSLHRFTGGTPDTQGELRARFERQARGRSPDGRECWLNWVVRDRATGHAVGTVQATITNEDGARVASLAWVIGTPHQGRGFAKEAAAAMASWLLEQGVSTLRANVHPDRAASIAVARSIGLQATAMTVDGERRWQSAPATTRPAAAAPRAAPRAS
jgi:RimJ/RimL family protein N-acetyltransferase